MLLCLAFTGLYCELTFEEVILGGGGSTSEDTPEGLGVPRKTPYIEMDNATGLTDGDTRLYIGARVQIGVIVNIDVCLVW